MYKIAETLFDVNKDFKPEFKINAAAEIFLTTQNKNIQILFLAIPI